jgi:hypothetical protein
MKWLMFLIPALIFGCAMNQPRGPLLVVCFDATGILYEGEADELLHLVPEGYWEFFDYRTHVLVKVHGNCRFVGGKE